MSGENVEYHMFESKEGDFKENAHPDLLLMDRRLADALTLR